MFILDTSALRPISRQKLELACRANTVAISTITVLELASHLNDSPDEGSFLRRKGNLAKCALPIMLDDPFWAWSTKLGSRVNKSRQEDKPALIELVQIVSRSDSLHQFSEQRIALPNGGTISCREIGNGIAVSLQEEEKDHQNRMIAKFKSLRLDPSMNGQHSLTDEAFLGILLALSTTFAHDDWFLAARAGLATAAYTGYMVCRAYFYANKRPKNVSEVNIDPNDCEDAYICLHIDLAQRDVLVTSDKGTIEALTRTTDLMNARLKPEVPRRCVMHTDEFLARLDSLTSIG